MPFDVVHPRDFPARFGVARVPTKSTLKRWRDSSGFPHALDVPKGHYRADDVKAWFSSRHAKPCTYLLQPDGERVQRMELRIHSVELLQTLLNANHADVLEAVPLTGDGSPDVVLVRRKLTAETLTDGIVYSVGGHPVQGRSLIAMRPKDAGAIPKFLVGDPLLSFVPLSPEEVSEFVQWTPPVADEQHNPQLDVQMLDEYARYLAEVAGAAALGNIIRVHGIDQAGKPAVSFNVPAGDWLAFRKTCLELYDRQWSVTHEWVIRAAPIVRGSNDETAPIFELAEIKAKAGGHAFEGVTPDGKPAFGVVHVQAVTGPALAKRTHRAVAVPGLPLYVGDSGVPLMAEWHMS